MSVAVYDFAGLSQELLDQVSAHLAATTAFPVRPMIVAFGGEGNCQKTSLAHALCAHISQQGTSAITIEIDDYAFSRSLRFSGGFSGYDPRSFDIGNFHCGLARLAAGVAIHKPYYDHRTGTPCKGCTKQEHGHRLSPARVIVAVGVYLDLLYENSERRADLSIFFHRIGPSHFFSRMRRDIFERGYDMTQATRNYRRMRRDYVRYIYPAASLYSHDCAVRSRGYLFQANGV